MSSLESEYYTGPQCDGRPIAIPWKCPVRSTLAFASTMDIDLASAFAEKMKKNALKYPAAQFRGRFA